MSKMKRWNDEPAIQQKEYSQEKYNKKKKRSLRVAKLSCYSGELAAVFGWNSMLSLILFLVLLLGTSAQNSKFSILKMVIPAIMTVSLPIFPSFCRSLIIF